MHSDAPHEDACEKAIEKILRDAKTIVVVGASDRAERDSFHIVQFLNEVGYTVLPVNPSYERVAGLTCYPSLEAIPKLGRPIDIVDVFRRSDAVDEVVDELLKLRLKAGCLWLQEGVVNHAAARRAADAGMQVVQNRCIYKEHVALL